MTFERETGEAMGLTLHLCSRSFVSAGENQTLESTSARTTYGIAGVYSGASSA